jgi:hypothetical protein
VALAELFKERMYVEGQRKIGVIARLMCVKVSITPSRPRVKTVCCILHGTYFSPHVLFSIVVSFCTSLPPHPATVVLIDHP